MKSSKKSTPGQARSKPRKLRCKKDKAARLAAEAHHRGISVCQAEAVLQTELTEASKVRRAIMREQHEQSSGYDDYLFRGQW